MALIETDGLPIPGESLPSVAEDIYAGYQDYFGGSNSEKWYFPDGKQYIEFQPMNEGQRAKYESSTSRDVRFNRRTDDAAIRMDAASDRRQLVMSSVTGWHVAKRSGNSLEPVPFSMGTPGSTFNQWYDKANPKLINSLVDAIRKANPWMTDDMTSEMIREEIKRLEELLTTVEEREAKEKN